MQQQDIINLVLLISPIYLIQLGVVVYALLDLRRRKVVRGERWMWAVVMILTAFALPSGLIVVGIYLVWGRNPDNPSDIAEEVDK